MLRRCLLLCCLRDVAATPAADMITRYAVLMLSCRCYMPLFVDIFLRCHFFFFFFFFAMLIFRCRYAALPYAFALMLMPRHAARCYVAAADG